MTKSEVAAIVMSLIEAVLGRAVVANSDTQLVRDLGFDSIRVLELVAEIEERFDITVPINELPDIRSVGQIVDRVHPEVSGSAT